MNHERQLFTPQDLRNKYPPGELDRFPVRVPGIVTDREEFQDSACPLIQVSLHQVLEIGLDTQTIRAVTIILIAANAHQIP
jgi:hypothetical protein